MPTYEYQCTACGYRWEKFQSIKADPDTVCPECQAETAQRLISGGGGVIFKGSGFYQTDYRSASYQADKKKEEAPPKANEAKSDKGSKSDTATAKPETSPSPTAK